MRMWKYVSFTRQTLGQINRPQMVEKDEWPDHASFSSGQKPSHFEAANVADSLI